MALAHSALSVAWFLVKTYAVILVIFWIRGTYPRLRIDQLMAFGWKLLVPLSFLNIVLTGVVMFYGLSLWVLGVASVVVLGGVFYLISRKPGTEIERDTVAVHAASTLRRSV